MLQALPRLGPTSGWEAAPGLKALQGGICHLEHGGRHALRAGCGSDVQLHRGGFGDCGQAGIKVVSYRF